MGVILRSVNEVCEETREATPTRHSARSPITDTRQGVTASPFPYMGCNETRVRSRPVAWAVAEPWISQTFLKRVTAHATGERSLCGPVLRFRAGVRRGARSRLYRPATLSVGSLSARARTQIQTAETLGQVPVR